jgi:hypothetical protein
VWGFEFTIKAAILKGDSAYFFSSPCKVALGPVVARARVLVHEKELTERRRVHSVEHARLEVEERRTGHVLASRGLVVKQVDAVELRVVVAAVHAVAADAVFVAHHFP